MKNNGWLLSPANPLSPTYMGRNHYYGGGYSEVNVNESTLLLSLAITAGILTIILMITYRKNWAEILICSVLFFIIHSLIMSLSIIALNKKPAVNTYKSTEKTTELTDAQKISLWQDKNLIKHKGEKLHVGIKIEIDSFGRAMAKVDECCSYLNINPSGTFNSYSKPDGTVFKSKKHAIACAQEWVEQIHKTDRHEFK